MFQPLSLPRAARLGKVTGTYTYRRELGLIFSLNLSYCCAANRTTKPTTGTPKIEALKISPQEEMKL